jgi:hypothetical protein
LYCSALCCIAFFVLQEAVKHQQYWRLKDKDGKPPGLIGW